MPTTTTAWRAVRGELDDDLVKQLDSLIQVSEEYTGMLPESYARSADDRLMNAGTIFDIAGAGVVGVVVRDRDGNDGAPEILIAWRADT